MPTKLYINIEADSASEAREEMARLLGTTTLVMGSVREKEDRFVPDETVAERVYEPAPAPEQAETPAHREFGKAPEGKTRRTKEEIAEDEELAELALKAGIPTDKLEDAVRKDGHQAVKAQIEDHLARTVPERREVRIAPTKQANISANPEDRQDPENPEDAAQDAADEQAEVDAARDAENPLTLDDLREAMNALVEKKGMPEVQKAGPAIFEKALGKPPAGETAWKLSLLSEATQDQLSAAIAAWKEAANG